MADEPKRSRYGRYAEVAHELRQEILGGRMAPGLALPSEARLAAQYETSKDTIRAALAALRAEGLVTTVKGGSTYIRDRRSVQLSLSQYSRTLHPGPPGPFSAAAQAAGLTGKVNIVSIEQHPADTDIAQRLELTEGDPVVVRTRHMTLGEVEPETVQISISTIPLMLVEGSPLAADKALRIYAAFVAIGITPTTMTEAVSARMPTPEEAEILGLAPGQPVLVQRRVTRDDRGRPIELLHVMATADRIELVYDDLPIAPSPEPDDTTR